MVFFENFNVYKYHILKTEEKIEEFENMREDEDVLASIFSFFF